MTCPHSSAVAAHPCEDGTIAYWPRAVLVRLSAALRSSGMECTVSAVSGTEDTWTPGPYSKRIDGLPAILTISWGPAGASRGGVFRLRAVEPGPRGSVGSVVELLPVAGLTSRPVARRADPDRHTMARALPAHVRRVSWHPAGDGAEVAAQVAWEARERIAREVLGADWERVQAA